MRTRFRIDAFGLGLALALIAGVAQAQAGLVTTIAETTSTVGSLTKYSYLVTDTAASTDNLGEFDLVVPADANLTMITNNAGFATFYTTGYPNLTFQSSASITDLTPGQSATFSFLSTDKPVVS